MELILAALPFAAFLVCPLMMVFCVFGMRRLACGMPQATETPQLPEERLVALQQQLRAIQSELAALQPAEPLAPLADGRGGDDRLIIDVVPGAADAARRPA